MNDVGIALADVSVDSKCAAFRRNRAALLFLSSIAALAQAAPAAEPEVRIQLSRQQTQLAQLQSRVSDLGEWRATAQKDNEGALARMQELHQLQQSLGNFVMAMHDDQASLAGEHAGMREQQRALNERLHDMIAQVQKEQTQTGARVTKIEEQGTGKIMLEFSNRLDLFNSELNKLRGLVEKLTYDLQNAEKRQNSMYGDLDARMRRFEGQGNVAADQKKDRELLADFESRLNKLEQAAAGGSSTTPTNAGPNPMPTPSAAAAAIAAPKALASPAAAAVPATSLPGASLSVTDAPAIQRAYETAYSSYKSGDFAAALAGFQNFVKRYPKHALAGNAQYWIGDTQLQLHEYPAAVLAQRELIEKYPESEKVPDALFVIGRAEFANNNPEAAKKTWEEVVAKYPTTPSADKARAQLLRMK